MCPFQDHSVSCYVHPTGKIGMHDSVGPERVLNVYCSWGPLLQVDRSPGFHEVRCFWLVRTDGSETDFSFHKCLKEKVVKEFPSFVDRYDILYGGSNRRPRGPTTNVEQAELQQIEGEGAQV